jgi:vacuolar protein sorting-associated protein 13D
MPTIAGHLDLFGNPAGLYDDVSKGVSGLLRGDVIGLVQNVTHGLSNTAAKVTGIKSIVPC